MLMYESVGQFFFNLRAARRFSAFALFAGASCLALHAQQPVVQAASAHPTIVADLAAKPALASSLADAAGISYSSSSSSVVAPVDPDAAADGLKLAADPSSGLQPPPRRRYGRPRYNDNSHNPDGSPKYTFVLGAGFTAPLGDTYHYLNTSYGIQAGGGRNFNKNFGVLLQFDYDRFGFNGRTLYNEQSLYNYGLSSSSQYYLSSLDGNSHIWSFSLNPVYTLNMQGAVGAYVVGGVGYFHKVANFTTPVNTYACYYFGCYPYTANEVIDHYTSNAPGFNGGLGLTYKVSRFAGERLFVEGRYNITLNSQRQGLTVQNINTTYGQNYLNTNGTDYYPANSNRTTWLAFKAGLRF